MRSGDPAIEYVNPRLLASVDALNMRGEPSEDAHPKLGGGRMCVNGGRSIEGVAGGYHMIVGSVRA